MSLDRRVPTVPDRAWAVATLRRSWSEATRVADGIDAGYCGARRHGGNARVKRLLGFAVRGDRRVLVGLQTSNEKRVAVNGLLESMVNVDES